MSPDPAPPVFPYVILLSAPSFARRVSLRPFYRGESETREVNSHTAAPRRDGGAGAYSCAVTDPQGSLLLRIFPVPQKVGLGKGKEEGKRRERRVGGRGRREEERDREKTVLAFLN